MTRPAAFRHDPVRQVIAKGVTAARDWRKQPAVVGFHRFQRFAPALKRDVDVPVSATPAVIEGVGVVIEAEHSCMTMRGVNVPGASLSTSCLLGVVRDDPRTREEFLRLVR